MTEKENIYVTRPSLPPLEDFIKSLDVIWKSKELTNNGPFHQEFEKQLAEFLGVKFVSVFSNGTLALMTALQALNIKGEVITTPYTFVATANSLIWNNLTPVFCDVDPIYGNLDTRKIEELITPLTTAIMPVHVYGNPCDVEAIDSISKKHKLKVIYDAAHAFGVRKNGNSILNFGDLSVLSFHATKTFNTIEGGAIISHDIKTKERIDNLKNFGITNEVTVVEPGINAKMNELQAAFGLLQLREIEENIKKRKQATLLYKELLNNTDGIRFLDEMPGVEYNYSYFPIFVSEKYKLSRDGLYENLKKENIYTRRYFYPLVSTFAPYNTYKTSNVSHLVNSTQLAEEVLCLPIYSDISTDTIQRICNLINSY